MGSGRCSRFPGFKLSAASGPDYLVATVPEAQARVPGVIGLLAVTLRRRQVGSARSRQHGID
jgi:hypothetical protein